MVADQDQLGEGVADRNPIFGQPAGVAPVGERDGWATCEQVSEAKHRLCWHDDVEVEPYRCGGTVGSISSLGSSSTMASTGQGPVPVRSAGAGRRKIITSTATMVAGVLSGVAGRCCVAPSIAASGNSTSNRAPPSRWSTKPTCPWCAATVSATRARPSPVPAEEPRVACPVMKRWKIAARSFAGTPGPWSSMKTTAWSSLRCRRTG